MPWKESSVMDERLGFVARLLEGEQMMVLCLGSGITRGCQRGMTRKSPPICHAA